MQRNPFALGFIVVLMSALAVAQMAPPSPAPELKKLDYFSGNWTIEATIGSGPWGGGGKFTSTGTGEWMKSGFFLVSHSEFSLPPEMGGSGTGLSVRSYDPNKKVYTDETFNNDGRHEIMTGTLNGDTWTWTGEADYGGMMIQQRMTLKVTSPASYTSKYEVSADGGATWKCPSGRAKEPKDKGQAGVPPAATSFSAKVGSRAIKLFVYNLSFGPSPYSFRGLADHRDLHG